MKRNDAENFRNLFKQTPEMVCVLAGKDHVFEFVNEAHVKVLGFDATGMAVRVAQPESIEVHGILDDVYSTGVTANLHELPVTVGKWLRYFNLTFSARRTLEGDINGIMILGNEVTDQVIYRDIMQSQNEAFELSLSGKPLNTVLPILAKSIERHLGSDVSAKILITPLGIQTNANDEDQRIYLPILSSSNKLLGTLVLKNLAEDYTSTNYKAFVDLIMKSAALILERCSEMETRTLAETALQQSEEQFRLFAEMAPQMPFICDAEGGVLYFNQRWYDYVGYSKEDTDGWGWTKTKIHHPDDLARVIEVWTDCIKTGKPYEVEHRLRRHDGEFRWHLGRAVPIRDKEGKIVRWYGTNVDIHDQKVATEELSLAVTAADLGFWDYSLADDKITWSEQLRVHYGFPEGQYSSTKAEVFAKVHPDDRSQVFAAVENTIQKGEPYHMEFRVMPEAGKVRWLDCRGDITYDTLGNPISMKGTSLDISKRKSDAELLQKSKESAEKANAIKSAFLANMSHEIRTPLGAILGFTELLKESGHDASDSEIYLDTIIRNGKTLTKIIDDILDLSKVEAGRLELETIGFSFPDLLDEIMMLFSEKANAQGIYLRLSAGSVVPSTIVSDPTRIRQILINVIGNAVKFTREGGVEVHVDVITCESGKVQVKVSVVDTGVGVNPNQREKIFSPFTQGDNSMARKYGGSGLGLALSKRLANALGGDIYIDESHIGNGCAFVVLFYANISDSCLIDLGQNAGAASRGSEGSLVGVNILLAEDVIDNQILVSKVLTRHGARVEIARNGAEAISKAQTANYDLVLMDIQMPGVDGYEATRRLRKGGFNKPIIALTAHAMLEDRLRTTQAGCNDHLTKPLNVKELIKAVEALVR